MEKIDVEYILHCVRNARVLLTQNELLKVDGLLNSAQMSLEEHLQTSHNSDYAKCPCCGEPWDIRRNRACKCGAVVQCKHFA